MSDFWSEIKKRSWKGVLDIHLETTYLLTCGMWVKFYVIVRPHKNNIERRINRNEIELACNELVSEGEITGACTDRRKIFKTQSCLCSCHIG